MVALRPPVSFWLRWSARDLRARWIQVGAIALIIALGSGLYSGLNSTAGWRKASYDASFAALRMYDLRVELSTGSFAETDALVGAVSSIPDAAALRAVEPRLIVATQVDASTGDETILVPGRLVGVDVSDGGPNVAAVDALEGRTLDAGDAGRMVGVLDEHFADHYGLAPSGTIEVSGGQPLRYVGRGLSPEYFLISGEQGGILAQANYAVVFAPIGTVQTLVGRPGEANSVAIRLRRGADVGAIERQVRTALSTQLPDVAVTVNRVGDDPVYRVLYDDIEGDRRFYNIFALLVLAGAAFAAFNLVGRIVEAQRREIGIGMALGAPRRALAIRPLLVGVEIAALGAAFGLGVAWLVAAAMASLLRGFFPLPEWRYPFDAAVYLRGLALGLALPVLATIIPVWRAVRVDPVDAVRPTSAPRVRGPLLGMLARLPLGSRSTTVMPFRNVLRAPRRTAMTALGIAAAIMVLVGVVGMVDSLFATIDGVDREVLKSTPDRYQVDLESFVPTDSPEVRAVDHASVVDASELQLRVGGTLERGSTEIPVLIQAVDMKSPIWRPTVADRARSSSPTIVISDKAASDLGVQPGDRITLRHPLRQGAGYRYVKSRVVVGGITPLPVRFTTFMDRTDVETLMGLEGLTNTLIVAPTHPTSEGQVERELFAIPGVASVQPVSAFTESVRDQLAQVLDFLTIVEGAVLLLAILIAFNSSSINADERARENATMLAFGLRVRSVLRMDATESLVIGLIGTAVGLGFGWLLLDWLVEELIPQTFPDIGLVTSISTSTLVIAFVLGVVAVTIAPVFTIRKLRRMNIPASLRVVE